TNGTYYIYFRAVNNVGRVGSVSSPQITKIDNVTPTITAKGSSYTIVQGSSNALPSTYFNVSTSGASGIASTTCKVGSTTYTNTSSMGVGTHTLTCTTTSNAGKSKSASTSIIVIAKPNQTIDDPGATEYIVPVTGYYKLEVWGASGDFFTKSTRTYPGGEGAYVSGNIYLQKGDKLYIYVGGSGASSGANRRFNGGGYGTTDGGGATDIRIGSGSLYNRVIVAGGGGGSGGASLSYQSGCRYGGGNNTYYEYEGSVGSFGIGGNGTSSGSSRTNGGGGGGGWYGGHGTRGRQKSSSSFPSGCGGMSFAFAAGYISNLPSSYALTTKYLMNNIVMKNGNETMPNPSGGTMTGKTGDGAARITYINGSTQSYVTSTTATFTYTGDIQTYQVPITGTYKIQLWGADGSGSEPGSGSSGCDSGDSSRGIGAYVSGTIYLTKGQVLYVYVGDKGQGKNTFNGTQTVAEQILQYRYAESGQSRFYTNAGGGATDIRTYGGAPMSLTSLNSRIAVAGGGGGMGTLVFSSSSSYTQRCSPGGNSTILSTSKTCSNTSDSLFTGIYGGGGFGTYATSGSYNDWESGGGGGGYCGGSSSGFTTMNGGSGGTSYLSSSFTSKVHLTGTSVPSSSRAGYGLAIIQYVG
ncbi:MAG: glycine rich domain-containing protein, partial [Bacilli bacterium]|nr:glycine rich domain-containing protein [Bacilli bacterium]